MQKNNKIDEQVITNIIRRHIKPIEQQKQIKLIINCTKFKMSNLMVKNTNFPKSSQNQTNVVYEFICPFQECLSEKDFKINTYIGYTTTILSRRVTYHLSDISAIKQYLITKHNDKKITSSDIRKILNDDSRTLNKIRKNRLRILEAI